MDIKLNLSENLYMTPTFINRGGVINDNLATTLTFSFPEHVQNLIKHLIIDYGDDEPAKKMLEGNSFRLDKKLTQKKLRFLIEFTDGEMIAQSTISEIGFSPTINGEIEYIPEESKDLFLELYGKAFVKAENVDNEIVFYNVLGNEVGRIQGGTDGGVEPTEDVTETLTLVSDIERLKRLLGVFTT